MSHDNTLSNSLLTMDLSWPGFSRDAHTDVQEIRPRDKTAPVLSAGRKDNACSFPLAKRLSTESRNKTNSSYVSLHGGLSHSKINNDLQIATCSRSESAPSHPV